MLADVVEEDTTGVVVAEVVAEVVVHRRAVSTLGEMTTLFRDASVKTTGPVAVAVMGVEEAKEDSTSVSDIPFDDEDKEGDDDDVS